MSFRQPLPVPRVSKTLEQIRAELFAQVEMVQDEYAAKGWLPARLNLNKGVVRGLWNCLPGVCGSCIRCLKLYCSRPCPCTLLANGWMCTAIRWASAAKVP